MAKTNSTSVKPFSSFIYKVLSIIILIALLPLLSSSEELSNKSFFSQSLELFQLLVVGIAISYGLFSQINSDNELEEENQLKLNSPQSYVSQILEISPLFNDDEEVKSPKGSDFTNKTKNQTWNFSQYYREKPMVMVADESTDAIDRNASLKSIDESSLISNENTEENEKVVLPSPIPWRSRSDRFYVKEDESSLPCHSLPTSDFYEELGTLRTRSFRSPSPKRVSSSYSLFQENRGKINEDLERKKSFDEFSPYSPPSSPLTHSSHLNSEKHDARKNTKNGCLEHDNYNDMILNSNLEKDSHIGKPVRSDRSSVVQNLPPLKRNKSDKRDEFVRKMIITSDSESDDVSDYSGTEEESDLEIVEADRGENEVDKKADEFINKFREQIRLQRIASIKKSRGRPTTILSR